MGLEIGAAAPDFTLPNAAGDNVSLTDFRGKTVVLYFYPKDDTSGCTAEACDFRDQHTELEALGVTVIGISPDSPKSHTKFATKYELPFLLLADEQKSVCESYGVWVEKSMYGRKYMGVERSTFVIDAQGVLREQFIKVKVPGHVTAVIAAVKAIG